MYFFNKINGKAGCGLTGFLIFLCHCCDDGDPNDMDKWTDKHNPDPALRSRKILGLNILKDMVYHEDTNTWEDGTIYDARHGREWNASAYIDKNGLLRVKGYWHLKFIGRTMAFRRL